MIVTADLHIKESTADLVLGKILPELIEIARGSFGKVVILGDVFDVRHVVPVWLLTGFRDFLQQAVQSAVTVRMIPGNHDQYDDQGRNVLEVFGDISGVAVFTKPHLDTKGILWMPYAPTAAIKQELSNPVAERARYVFGHFAALGAERDPHHLDTEGVDSAQYPQQFVLGHYHKPQHIGNLTYVGSPYQTRSSEAGQVKGYLEIRAGDQLVFQEKGWGPKYHTLQLGARDELDVQGMSQGDDVRITAAKGADIDKMTRQLEAAKVRFVITPEVEDIEARLDVDPHADLLEYAEAYIGLGDTPEGVSPGELKDAFRRLWQHWQVPEGE